MKYFVTFVIVPLLTSCVFMAKPLPTSTLPSVMAKQTETSVTTSITPSVTNPFAVPKAINTPHIIPTKIGQITSQESFRLYDERVKAFENTLQFDIKVSDAKINKFEKHSRYLISAEGKLTNIANHPIVVRRNLSTGFTGNEDIRWDFFLGNTELGYFICCVDIFGNFLAKDDFVILQPGEFQNYNLPFELPLEISDSKGTEVNLSGKNITLVATYFNIDIGYDEGPPFDSTKHIDMNSWVGEVQSNSVEYVFP